MGLCSVAVALCLIYKYYMASIVFLLFFIGFFSIGTGSVAWVYCSEVTMDKAAGLVAGSMFGTSLIYTVAMEYMMESRMQAHGTFFLFGGVSIVGSIFVLLFIKETKGLSDKEKKRLFTPISGIEPEIELSDQTKSEKNPNATDARMETVAELIEPEESNIIS